MSRESVAVDLRAWYQLALEYGLPDDPHIAKNIDHLQELRVRATAEAQILAVRAPFRLSFDDDSISYKIVEGKYSYPTTMEP